MASAFRPYFVRRPSWQRAVAYIEDLLSTTGRKNAWQLAGVSGHATPYGFQHLLGRALWQGRDSPELPDRCIVDLRQSPGSDVAGPRLIPARVVEQGR